MYCNYNQYYILCVNGLMGMGGIKIFSFHKNL